MNKQEIERFVTHASVQMPELFKRSNLYDTEVYDDEAVLEFRLPKAIDVEAFMDTLDDRPELILLYHVVPSAATKLGQRCAAYVNPTSGRMYKINGRTDDNGAIDTVYVTLYDSLMTMGMDVRSELAEMTGKYHAEFARADIEVVKDFMR